MTSKLQAVLVCVVLCTALGPTLLNACPPSCTCDVPKRGEAEFSEIDARTGRREVICKGRSLTSPISPDIIPDDTVKLDLSYNDITVLHRDAFQGLSSLLKLDLSNNKISYIETRSFDGLNSIESLDLSSNQLGSVNNSMFTSLDSVRRLNLSSNQISSLSVAAFDRLHSLEKVDFSSEYLVCDCHLKWIVTWKRTKGVRISDNTICAYPQSLRGQRVRSLKRRELHCDWPLELPMFEINPDNSQVVFKGDDIPIDCKATYLDDSEKIIWLKNGEVLANNKDNITIETVILKEQAIIQSTLTVHNVRINNTSKRAWEFECRVMTSRGNMRKTVTVIVFDGSTQYCEPSTTHDNKGRIDWPKTIAGLPMKMPCPNGPGSTFKGPGSAEAMRPCGEDGKWTDPDTVQCQYADVVTRKLQLFSMMDFNNASIALSTAQQVADMTSNGATIRDLMIVVYIGKMFETFSKYWNRELGKILINIAGNLMDTNPSVLRQSQLIDMSCTKIVLALEKFASNILHEKDEPFNYAAPNIALEAFQVTAESFNGRNCALFVSGNGLIVDDQYFECFPGNISTQEMTIKSMSVDVSIRIPRTVFSNLHAQSGSSGLVIYKLQFFVYKNGNLFPTITNTSQTADDRGRRTVTSYVISSKIANYTVSHLEKPAVLTFRPAPGGKDTVAAYWDFNAVGGKGAWKTDGCELMEESANMTQVKCNHLTNFAILKDMNSYADQSGSDLPWSTGLLHPAIYVGSWVFVVFVVLTLVTYIIFHRNIRMKRKCRHSLMNICLAMLLLVSFYTGGINRLDPTLMCQIVGIGIHYFSISTIMWMAISARNLLKALARRERTLPPGEVAPPRRPIMGFYFIGWGVPGIIVGITAAAADIKKYGGKDFCWMNFNISLAAFFGVVALIVLIVCFMYIGIAIRMQHAPPHMTYDLPNSDPNADNNKDYSRSPDGIDHHMNIDSESVITHRTDRTGVSVISSIVDGEYTAHKQLHATVFLMFGFLATWAFGAMAVTQKDFMIILFSCLYGGSVACMGIFIFTYNCALRTDVMYNWRRVCGRRRDSYAIAGSPAVQGPQMHSNGHVVQRRHSASSVDSYNTNRSHNTNQSNHSLKSGSRRTTSKCNYIPSHTNAGTDASIDSSAQDTISRPHMYEKHRGNGYTHRNHHKVRTRPKHYRQQRYDPLAVRYVEDPSDTFDNPDLSSAIPSGGDSIASGHISSPPMVIYSHRNGHEGGSLCLGYQPENISMHSMHSMPAEPHKIPKPYTDGVLLTNFPHSLPSVTHTAPRKMPLKVPPPMPPRTASLDRRDRGVQHQRQPSSSQDEQYKPPYCSVQKREPVEKPIYAVIRPPNREKNTDHQRVPSREIMPFEHQRAPSREIIPFDHQRAPSREILPFYHQRAPSREHISFEHQKAPSREIIPFDHSRAPSREHVSFDHPQVPNVEHSPFDHQQIPSREHSPYDHQRVPSREHIPFAALRDQSREQVVPLADGRRPGMPEPPTYAQVMPDPEGQGPPRVVVGKDPEIDKAFNEIDDSMAAIMAASRELLNTSSNNTVDSDSKSDKKETSV